MEKVELECRDKRKLFAFFGLFELLGFGCKDESNKCWMETSSTSEMPSIVMLEEETNPVVVDNNEFGKTNKSKLKADLRGYDLSGFYCRDQNQWFSNRIFFHRFFISGWDLGGRTSVVNMKNLFEPRDERRQT